MKFQIVIDIDSMHEREFHGAVITVDGKQCPIVPAPFGYETSMEELPEEESVAAFAAEKVAEAVEAILEVCKRAERRVPGIKPHDEVPERHRSFVADDFDDSWDDEDADDDDE